MADPTLTDLRALAERYVASGAGGCSIADADTILALLDQLAESERVRDVYQGTTETLTGIVAELLGVPADDDAAIVDALKKARTGSLAPLDRVESAESTSRRWNQIAEEEREKLHEAESTIARLTSETEALRALVPSDEERRHLWTALSRSGPGWSGLIEAASWLRRVDNASLEMALDEWQRIEAARAAKGGG